RCAGSGRHWRNREAAAALIVSLWFARWRFVTHAVAMSDADNDIALAAEFPPATHQQWRALVESVLKGASFDQKLVAKTSDGLAIAPLYARRTQARPVVGRAPGRPWQLIQR